MKHTSNVVTTPLPDKSVVFQNRFYLRSKDATSLTQFGVHALYTRVCGHHCQAVAHTRTHDTCLLDMRALDSRVCRGACEWPPRV